MTYTLKFHAIGGALLLILLSCFGCKKDNDCNPTASKYIVSEVYDNGYAISHKYADNVITESSSSDGLTIDYQINRKDSELLFEEWDYKKDVHNPGTLKLIGTYYLGTGPLNVPRENLQRANAYFREGGGTQIFEYNNNGNLTQSTLTFPPNFNIPPQIVINTWQDGNMMSSVRHGVTTTYEYYSDKVNTIGNEYFGKTYLGVSSKNPTKKEISGNLTTDYTYEFDEECYITKVTTTTTDETGKVLSTSWRQFTYE